MRNCLDLSDGLVDILRGVVRREIQRIMAREHWLANETCNIDKAAHLLRIYDKLTIIASKWLKNHPQSHITLDEVNKYLAMDGTLKPIPSPD